MSGRALALLTLLLAAVLLLVLWVDRPQDEPRPSEAPPRSLFDDDPADVRAVEMEVEGRSWRIERVAAGGWRLRGALDAEADPRRVEGMVLSLRDIRVLRVVESRAGTPSRFGLDPPEARVRLETRGGTRTVLVGRASPVGSDRYASTGVGDVLLVDGSILTSVARSPEDFRENRLLPVAAKDVRTISIEGAVGRVLLAREGSGWRLLEPVRDVADADRAERAVAAASDLAATEIVEGAHGEEASRAFRAALRIVVEAEGRREPLRAEIAPGVPGSDERMARRVSGDWIGAISSRALADLDLAPAKFRDPRPLPFSAPDVLGIAFSREGTTLRVRREKEGSPWILDGGAGSPVTADAEAVDGWLERIRTLRAVEVGDLEAEAGRDAWAVEIVGAEGLVGRLGCAEGPPRPPAAGGGAGKRMLRVTSSRRPGCSFDVVAEDLGAPPASVSDLAAAPGGRRSAR